MHNPNELRGKREALIAQGESLVLRIHNENRAWSPKEVEELDGIQAEIVKVQAALVQCLQPLDELECGVDSTL